MSNLYIDLETSNNGNEELINCEMEANFSRHIPTEYNRISVQKLNISCSAMHFMSVPIKQPQNYDHLKQDAGYFETIYSLKFLFGNGTQEIAPIWFHNSEIQNFNYDSIQYQLETGGRVYDNRNDYFKISNLNTLLKCINSTIKEVLVRYYTELYTITADADIFKLCPTFVTKDNVLNCTIISTYENDLIDLKQISDPEQMPQMIEDVKLDAFCMGLSANLGDMIYRSFSTKTNENYLFLQESGLDDYLKIELETTPPQIYYIATFSNTDFFEYMNDIKEIIITSNINVIPRIKTIKPRSFYLNDPSTTYTPLNGVLHVFDISHDREKISVLHYSNQNIDGNYSTLNEDAVSSYRVSVNYVDKYGIIYRHVLKQNEYAKVVLVLFRDREYGKRRRNIAIHQSVNENEEMFY